MARVLSQEALEHRRKHQKEYYQNNKARWKNPDGSWKKEPASVRNERMKNRYHSEPGFKERHSETQKRYRDSRRQIGTCPLCLKENCHLYWDHDHESGLFRGWICSSCNLLLGHAFDNPDTLRRAALYLEKFNERRSRKFPIKVRISVPRGQIR